MSRPPGRPPTPQGRLTKREQQVLTLLVQGHTYADTATTLGMTHRTAINHMIKARKRVGARHTIHLIALAITAGDIDPDCADGTAVTR